MNFNPENKQCSIVLIGDFNPAMFHPEWFRKNNVLSDEEVDYATSQSNDSKLIVTSHLTSFKTSQFIIKVEQKRFEVIGYKEPYMMVSDFISKTFETLTGFVIKAYGCNFSAHYHIDTLSNYQRIGDNLAPKKYWKNLLGKEITGDDRKSGLTTIQMQKIKENSDGHISMLLQPSVMIKQGVFITCNDHTNVSEDDYDTDQIVREISNSFNDSLTNMIELQKELLIEAVRENE